MSMRDDFERNFQPPLGVYWDGELQQYEPRSPDFEPDADAYHWQWQVWQVATNQQGILDGSASCQENLDNSGPEPFISMSLVEPEPGVLRIRKWKTHGPVSAGDYRLYPKPSAGQVRGTTELMPCPFCGTEAEIKGGLEAQENYSVWCRKGHHLEGGYDRQKMIDKWNQRAMPEITPAMIEAGAKRLVRWDDGCVWPDSWDGMDIAAAKQEAERVIRSALSVASCQENLDNSDHIAGSNKMVERLAGSLTDLLYQYDDLDIGVPEPPAMTRAVEMAGCLISEMNGAVAHPARTGVPEWISVDDSLPDADLQVLVYSPVIDDVEFDYVDVCADTGDEWFAGDSGRYITHWAHIPTPPATQEGSGDE